MVESSHPTVTDTPLVTEGGLSWNPGSQKINPRCNGKHEVSMMKSNLSHDNTMVFMCFVILFVTFFPNV